MPFNNSSIVAPVAGKPHIKFVDGYWRVSPVKWQQQKSTYQFWVDAHRFVRMLNKSRFPKRRM